MLSTKKKNAFKSIFQKIFGYNKFKVIADNLYLVFFFFPSYVWKHVRYHVLISRQPGVITQFR